MTMQTCDDCGTTRGVVWEETWQRSLCPSCSQTRADRHRFQEDVLPVVDATDQRGGPRLRDQLHTMEPGQDDPQRPAHRAKMDEQESRAPEAC